MAVITYHKDKFFVVRPIEEVLVVLYEELIVGIKQVKLAELREDSADYFEVVAFNTDLPSLTVSLEMFFGPSYFPPHEQLPEHIRGDVDNRGGIMPGQVLYYCNKSGAMVIAMLWPWRDGQRTTLKIIKRSE